MSDVNRMIPTRKGSCVQVEVRPGVAVLLTVGPHDEYGFSGNIVTKDQRGVKRIIRFHGDGLNGICLHEEEDF